MTAISGTRRAMKEMKGETFGLFTVIEEAPSIRGTAAWTCRCECGAIRVIAGAQLRYGSYKSCGCRRGESVSSVLRKHGARRSADPALRRLYAAWLGMKARCRNPKHKDYRYYGARGLDVCSRWESFENFLADMGVRPEGKTLDRIDPNLGYSPENCRWATHLEQRANQRRCMQ